MGARHVAELHRLPQTGEGHEVRKILLVRPTSMDVREIGKPFDFGGDVGKVLELGNGECTGWHHRGRGRHRVPPLFFAATKRAPL
jgi:hypothetical protein